jgi:hypothetical protein
MNDKRKFFLLIFIPIGSFCILVLIMQLFLSFYTQSPYQAKHLSFLNFLLPGIITIFFIVLMLIEVSRRRANRSKFYLAIIILAESIAIKWQIEFLIWSIGNSFFDSFPIVVGIISFIFVLTKLIIGVISEKK